MIQFLLKGLIRDKGRSMLPIIVVTTGAFLTVLLSAWMQGIFTDMIDMNAHFITGHVKITTRAYAKNESQIPNDLALLGTNELIKKLNKKFPQMQWVPRIQFAGLLDIPDSVGETRAQGPAVGKGIDLLSPQSKEVERMNLKKSLVKGKIPQKRDEALISDDFAKQFHVKIGDKITLFSTTMDGSMAFKTFVVSGTIRFGTTVLDKGAIIVDISDARQALDMDNAAGEILGYFKTGRYDDTEASKIKEAFNTLYSKSNDEFSPQMFTLRDQNNLGQYLELAHRMSGIMIFIFVVAMSIVLWNSGLLGGLRRYTEYGIRLALGENKGHIYKTMLYEAVLIGTIGSVMGTILGLAAAYYLQEVGLDFSSMMKNVTMLMPPIYKARITPELFYIGFFPGLLATTLGNALAGFAIYKRETARLFRELDV